MKKVLRWIVLVWSVLTIPYLLEGDSDVVFFSLVFVGLIVGLTISDLRAEKR